MTSWLPGQQKDIRQIDKLKSAWTRDRALLWNIADYYTPFSKVFKDVKIF
ncbi:hypothetical protein Krac_11800 [Ktedonobacter racemifer DSM 44963]|uniref:Uncharacterized protein n=1 Tax=Ktedonobacter racemifer DSM 44963 TaxID=485913 RepID=D6TDQ8_KTERA|nr:hypothetical protein Krac_11800 [Ktedonobacter racemifer DSM 44963]